jgi:hypothetical protein
VHNEELEELEVRINSLARLTEATLPPVELLDLTTALERRLAKL